jgi:predicted MPP superfamily phosphohydrolase
MQSWEELVDYVDLPLPHASAAVQGLRIAHITDLHIHGHRRRHKQIADALRCTKPDLVMFTGDYVTRWQRHNVASEVLERLCAATDPRLGRFGVFGNHDPPLLRKQFETLPIRWLNDAVYRFDDLPLEIWGADTHETLGQDSVPLAQQIVGQSSPEPTGAQDATLPVRLLLCHLPAFMPSAADLSADVMMSGHSHGGQIRLPLVGPLRNSSDLPLRLTSGLLRHRNTLCCISRGLGEVVLPVRLFCPPQLPLYTLRRDDLPGAYSDHIVNVRPW